MSPDFFVFVFPHEKKKTQIISDSPSEFLKKKRLHDDNFKS